MELGEGRGYVVIVRHAVNQPLQHLGTALVCAGLAIQPAENGERVVCGESRKVQIGIHEMITGCLLLPVARGVTSKMFPDI